MRIRSWQAILFLAAGSASAVLAEIPRGDWLTPAAMSLSAGVTAFSLMGAAALLGGRWRFVEAGFGGLDRVYRVHKWLGVCALGFASFHLVFKAGMEGWDTASILALPPFHTRLVRQLSFVALMLIVMLALNRAIRYSAWRWWHKLSGPLFLIVILHWLSFKTPIAITDPAGVWLAIATLGVAAAAYKLLLYPLLSRHAEYRITAVSPGAAAVHLELAPVRRPIAFTPGQFAFLSMKEDGLRRTVHDCGRQRRERQRESRDPLARRLHAETAQENDRRHARRPLCTVGTVQAARDCEAGGLDRRGSRHLAVHRVASGSILRGLRQGDAVLLLYARPGFPPVEVLDAMARERGADVPVSGGPADTSFTRRFDDVVRVAGAGSVEIFFCGPKGLLSAVRARMREHGIPAGNLRHEYFEFR